MNLISREAAIDALMHILDLPTHAEFLYTDEICKTMNSVPAVPAVPLDKLAKWIVENLDPRCDCNYCFNEDTDFEDRECCNCPKMSEEQVKEALTKWMEEQDADRQ